MPYAMFLKQQRTVEENELVGLMMVHIAESILYHLTFAVDGWLVYRESGIRV